jgi:hypothetical protein
MKEEFAEREYLLFNAYLLLMNFEIEDYHDAFKPYTNEDYYMWCNGQSVAYDSLFELGHNFAMCDESITDVDKLLRIMRILAKNHEEYEIAKVLQLFRDDLVEVLLDIEDNWEVID